MKPAPSPAERMDDAEFERHLTDSHVNDGIKEFCPIVAEARRARAAERDLAAYVATATKALRTIHELVDAELDPGDGCIKEIAAAALAEVKK